MYTGTQIFDKSDALIKRFVCLCIFPNDKSESNAFRVTKFGAHDDSPGIMGVRGQRSRSHD